MLTRLATFYSLGEWKELGRIISQDIITLLVHLQTRRLKLSEHQDQLSLHYQRPKREFEVYTTDRVHTDLIILSNNADMRPWPRSILQKAVSLRLIVQMTYFMG